MITSSDVLKLSNWGSFEEIYFVLKSAISEEKRSVRDIETYCMGSREHIRISTSAILSFLEFINVIERVNGEVCISQLGRQIVSSNIETNDFRQTIIGLLFKKAYEDDIFSEFFEQILVKFDTQVGKYYLTNSSILLKFSALRNFLIKNSFLFPNSKNKEIMFIEKDFLSIVNEYVLPLRKKITIEQFKQAQLSKEAAGKAAEEFVLAYEIKRLQGHIKISNIERISDFDVAAGFDIVSFHNKESKKLDRFIEVKSFSEYVSFFWSAEEIESSKRRGKGYFIYLVDRSRINEENYHPEIIENAYESIFLNKGNWEKSCKNYFFSKK